MAFSVATESSEAYEIGDIIRFPQIITDVNPGFPGWNAETHMFMCPYSGLYLFIATIYRNYNFDNILACIRKSNLQEGEDIVCLENFVIVSDVSTPIYSSTMSTITHCQAGGSLWVEVRGHDGDLSDAPIRRHNHFLGMLLKEGAGDIFKEGAGDIFKEGAADIFKEGAGDIFK